MIEAQFKNEQHGFVNFLLLTSQREVTRTSLSPFCLSIVFCLPILTYIAMTSWVKQPIKQSEKFVAGKTYRADLISLA